MPYISIETGAKLSQQDKQVIASGLGEIITAIPGKNMSNLMLGIRDDVFMAYAERDSRDCLHMHVLLRGAATIEQKDKVVADSCRLFEKISGIKADGIYVTFEELPNWGARGSYL